MKKLDFMQMETLRGGATEMGAATGITEIDDYATKKSCWLEGIAVFGGVIVSLGGTGFTGGLSWGLTVLSYAQYIDCKHGQM